MRRAAAARGPGGAAAGGRRPGRARPRGGARWRPAAAAGGARRRGARGARSAARSAAAAAQTPLRLIYFTITLRPNVFRLQSVSGDRRGRTRAPRSTRARPRLAPAQSCTAAAAATVLYIHLVWRPGTNCRPTAAPIAAYARATSRLLSPGQHVLGGRGRRELGGEVRVLERLVRVRVRASELG